MKRTLKKGLRWINAWVRRPGVIYAARSDTVERSIHVRQWLPIYLTCATLLAYLAAPGTVTMMAAITTAGLLSFEVWWAWCMVQHVSASRRLRYAVMQVGDEIEEEISLINQDLWLPVLWVEFIDRSNLPGYTVSSVRAIGPDSNQSWRARTLCTRRGVFVLGPWELHMGTPLAFFEIQHVYPQPQEVLVYPPMAVLPDRILSHRGALGSHHPLNQPLRAETILSTTVRAYAPGDALRHVHWPTTARRDQPFVKVFAPEAASSVWLITDLDATTHYEQGQSASLETLITITASLAATLLQENLAVGLYAGSQETHALVLPQRGSATHLWSILRALAPLQVVHSAALEDVLVQTRGLIGGSDLIILLTASLRPAWAETLRRMARSRSGLLRSQILLLDPASYGGPSGEAFLPYLQGLGLPAVLLHEEDITRISGYYGEISRWEFQVLGTGRAVPRRTPRTHNTAPNPRER